MRVCNDYVRKVVTVPGDCARPLACTGRQRGCRNRTSPFGPIHLSGLHVNRPSERKMESSGSFNAVASLVFALGSGEIRTQSSTIYRFRLIVSAASQTPSKATGSGMRGSLFDGRNLASKDVQIGGPITLI
jgi:hypothetical protein